jgi:GNAT superfamily N-acetyltransferase
MGEVTPITTALGVGISAPSAITIAHDLAPFHCGNEALDDWLRHRALKSEGRTARTFVVALGRQVVGYYCLANGATNRANVPRKIAKNTPESIPLITIGRLAVDASHQGQGIGKGLLKDALQRSLQISQSSGMRAVFVHAIDDNAMAFYLKFGFMEFPLGTKTLFLPIETIAAAL